MPTLSVGYCVCGHADMPISSCTQSGRKMPQDTRMSFLGSCITRSYEEEDNLLNYYCRPMDLSTIKKNIELGVRT